MENTQTAAVFEEIADLLELREDNPFRIRSYRNAARTVRNLPDRLETLVERDKDLSSIPGIGESLAVKIREIDAGMQHFKLLAGMEVDILRNGALDLKEKTLASLDWVVAVVHYDRAMSSKDMTERILTALRSGVVHCLGHPLGRIIGRREPISVDMDRIIEACVAYNVRLEINCQPDRLDLPDNLCRHARDGGAEFALATDAHSTDDFRFMPLGVNVARRGWLRKRDVLNTRSIAGIEQELGI